jgi:hypothetical protein
MEKIMEYSSIGKKAVKDINEWKEIFVNNPNKKSHWKEGRSAYELANFMLNKNGEKIIKKYLEKTLNEEISFSKGYIELEVKFDKYGHGREHDLGLWGKTNSGKTIFVGIESKVDELFRETIKEAYIKNKVNELNGKKTNAVKRIENLLKRNFQSITEKHFEIRYQLIYSTVGTIMAMDNKQAADISIFLIIVFKSNSYDIDIGKRNYNDFQCFIKEINCKKILKNKNMEMYKTNIDNKDLYIGHIIIE